MDIIHRVHFIYLCMGHKQYVVAGFGETSHKASNLYQMKELAP